MSHSWDYEVLRDRLTAERLSSYLAACGGRLPNAFALYEWNMTASAAALTTIAMTEVAVRNGLDQELRRWATSRGQRSWFDSVPLDVKGQRDIATARDRASRRGRPEVHGKVVAELPLGFWRYLVASRYLTSLWTPALYAAFPAGHPDVTSRRVEVARTLDRLTFLRNRAAHHEPIHRRDLRRDHDVAVELCGWMCPDLARWVEARSPIPDVVGRRPV